MPIIICPKCGHRISSTLGYCPFCDNDSDPESEDGSLQFVERPGGYYVFGRNSNETDIKIPAFYNGKPVIGISIGGFQDNDSIESVELPKTIRFIERNAFYSCTSLKSVSLNEGVLYIAQDAFNNCASLTGEIEIPETVLWVGKAAFENCGQITSIKIKGAKTRLEMPLFMYCKNLINIEVSQNNAYYKTIDGILYSKNGNSLIYCPLAMGNIFQEDGYYMNVSIPDGVIKIEDYAFYEHPFLGRVTMPDSILAIGKYAFFKSSVTPMNLSKHLLTIEEAAFAGCDSMRLEQESLPMTLISIGDFAFKDCGCIRSVIIPKTVALMGQGVFQGLTDDGLTSETKVFCEIEQEPKTWNIFWKRGFLERDINNIFWLTNDSSKKDGHHWIKTDDGPMILK